MIYIFNPGDGLNVQCTNEGHVAMRWYESGRNPTRALYRKEYGAEKPLERFFKDLHEWCEVDRAGVQVKVLERVLQ